MAQAPSAVIVGLMSGTSLDGISAAVVRFSDRDDGAVAWELLAFDVTPYADDERRRLSECLTGTSPAAYCRTHYDLGDWLARAANTVIAQAGVPRGEITAVASHGQTVWHEPAHSTWQIGQSAVIAEHTGLPVISDFRARDIAAGGQGAPLVPIADALLFAASDHWRVLQNLGGIGNLTVVAPGSQAAATRAFDTGPGVVVIDGVTQRLTGERYDRDGAHARGGRVIDAVVESALQDPYFSAEPPKSTGRELFDAAFIERFLADCRRASAATAADVIASAVALTARSIGLALRRFVPEPVKEIVLSGGGSKNPVLRGAIAREVAPIPAVLFDDIFFDGEAKEAVAFALLGYLHVRRRPGNVPRATGARGERVLGSWTPA
ncbi:MAG: anhydro-N-acetylmuramic acid kinase [Gemmatimonadaceae bacterium]